MNLIASYKNGNTWVELYDDGTKIRRFNNTQPIIPEFPECIDLNISNRCDMGCKFCYQNSSIDGKVADLSKFKQFFDSIHSGTELAINGNDVTDSQLPGFLEYLKSRNIIANVTVNQNHFVKHYDIIENWINRQLIRGVGVSINGVANEELVSLILDTPNVVCHTIAGVTTKKVFNSLANENIRLLILGYKDIGRGVTFRSAVVDSNIRWLYDNVHSILRYYKVVSFDNLALKQLNIKRFVKDWDKFYMGDDGSHTMYVDLVKQKFYTTSIESDVEGHVMTNDIKQMFATIRRSKGFEVYDEQYA